MRVLHVTAGNLFGGIERMLLTVAASAQPETEHRIAVCFDGRLARELRAAGTPPSILGAARFSRPDAMWRARRALKKLIASLDPAAVIAHAPWSSALAAPVVRRAGMPLLTWVHDAPQPAAFLERRMVAHPPDHFICNSAYTAGLTAAWLPQVPRQIIHPPVAPPAPLPSSARLALRREGGADDTTTVILIAARLEEWKGHRVLLEAAARLRGSVVVWVAGAPQRPHEAGYLTSLTEFAARHLPAGRVRFLGERDDVPRLMAAADVYCQPNTAPEPFGVVFVEALAAGVPVVTTAIGGALEIVDDRCGILVETAAAEPLAAALQRLIDDAGIRAALAVEGPGRASRLSDPASRQRQIADAVRALRTRTSAA